MSQYHVMAHRIFPFGPFVCVMDVYYFCVFAFIVVAGMRFSVHKINWLVLMLKVILCRMAWCILCVYCIL